MLAPAVLTALLALAPPPAAAPKLLYTTYFYTAGEAVVHGYEADTQVRIVSLAEGGRGTVWEGKVGVGETQMVQTGAGVFGFLADKKASILVGTPSSCVAVGYFVKDQNGSFRSNHFFTELPSATYMQDERVLVWAPEDTFVTVHDRTAKKELARGKVKAGRYLELPTSALARLGSHVLEVSTDGPAASVQVYYDEGFTVPATNGRAVGREFLTYVGKLTAGSNDLNLMPQFGDAQVAVTDVDSGEVLFKGLVKANALHSMTLAGKRVKVTSDADLGVSVAGFKVNGAGYAEQHFGAGVEGTGIETDLRLSSPADLYLFSYYDKNPITVTDVATGKQVFAGTLDAGRAKTLTPGFGYFRVRSQKGVSAMAGYSSCGADYSPAGSMFAVDEALFDVIAQVRADRLERARALGQVATEDQLSAPLTDAEAAPAAAAVSKKTGRKAISLEEVKARAATLQQQK